jgi:hypothetical protein
MKKKLEEDFKFNADTEEESTGQPQLVLARRILRQFQMVR